MFNGLYSTQKCLPVSVTNPSSLMSVEKTAQKYTDPLTTLPLNPQFWSTKKIQNPATNLAIQEHLGRKCLQINVNQGDKEQSEGNPKTTE